MIAHEDEDEDNCLSQNLTDTEQRSFNNGLKLTLN
jgi:hypothetical protein